MWGKWCINSTLYRYSNESKVSSSGSYFLEYITACGSLYEFGTRNWEVKENCVITWNTYSQHTDLFQRPQYWFTSLRRAVGKDRTSIPSSSAFEWEPMVLMFLFPLCAGPNSRSEPSSLSEAPLGLWTEAKMRAGCYIANITLLECTLCESRSQKSMNTLMLVLRWLTIFVQKYPAPWNAEIRSAI